MLHIYFILAFICLFKINVSIHIEKVFFFYLYFYTYLTFRGVTLRISVQTLMNWSSKVKADWSRYFWAHL